MRIFLSLALLLSLLCLVYAQQPRLPYTPLSNEAVDVSNQYYHPYLGNTVEQQSHMVVQHPQTGQMYLVPQSGIDMQQPHDIHSQQLEHVSTPNDFSTQGIGGGLGYGEYMHIGAMLHLHV